MKTTIISSTTSLPATKWPPFTSHYRALGIALAAAAAMVAAPQAAHASPGCEAFNGRFGPNFVSIGNSSASNFSAGDIITISITGGGLVSLVDATAGTNLVGDTAGTATYTIPADTPNEIAISYGDVDRPSVLTWSCVAGRTGSSGPSAPTDSQKLNSVMKTVAPLTAVLSAQTMTSSVDTAINDAFGDGGAPISGSDSGLRFNFAADPAARAADQAPALQALAYAAGNNAAAVKAPNRFSSKVWSLWADIQGAGFKNNAANGLNGRQINVTAGLGYKLTPDWLLGAIVGYEQYNYDIASLNGSLKGQGATIGAYTGYRLTPTLRWDGMLSWTRVSYDASSGSVTADIDGSRWVGSTGVTGNYRWHGLIIEPSSKLFAMWQRDNAYTDSSGNAQPGSSYMSGRVATGGRIIVPWTLSSGWTAAPYVGAYGDWRFGSTATTDVTVSGISQGWSGRVTGGLSLAKTQNMALSLGGEYGGIGADYKLWSGRARIDVRF